MFAKIAGWIPDSDETSLGILTDVQDMIPTLRGYAGVPSPISVGLPALPSECRGAAYVVALDESNLLFGGTQTKLYKAGSSACEDVSKAGDYTGSSSSRWCFAQQGNVTLAVNKTDEPQYYLSGTSTDFADVTGMPQCSIVEAVGQFILIGDYDSTPDGWACSALGDYTDWVADTTTQCTYGRLIDTPGKVTGIKRLMDYAIFYKRKSMYLARYVGSPFVWDFSLISDTVGSYQDSIVRVNTSHYFVGENDFYVFDSASIQPIGGPIKEWFERDCNNAKRNLIQGLHDQNKGLIYWFYPQGTSQTLNAWVAYSYRSNQWGKGNLDIETAVQYVASAISYDGLNALYSTYDSFPNVSYDDLSPAGNTILPAVVNTSHTLMKLTGVSDSSSMTSGLFGGELSLLSRVRPRFLNQPTTAELTHYHCRNVGDSLTAEPVTSLDDGKFDMLQTDRWHKVVTDFTGDVEITGAEITLQADGIE